ncbi:MAG: HlyD family secretion protein [Salibacteraceae bacterium]
MDIHSEELQTYSDEVKDVLSRPPKSIYRWGNTVLLGFVLLLVFVACFIEYPDLVVGRAIITTAIPPQKVYAPADGIVDSLFVRDLEKVAKNSPIALLENTADYGDVLLLNSILDTLTLGRSSFFFPLDALPILMLGEIEPQFSAFERHYLNYLQQKLHQPYAVRDQTHAFVVEQLHQRLNNLRDQSATAERELLLVQKDLKRQDRLFQEGVISQQELEQKQLAVFQAERNRNTISGTMLHIKELLRRSQNERQQNQISSSTETAALLKNVVQSYSALKRALRAWEQRYLLRSKMDGAVSFMRDLSANQQLIRGELIFTVIADENPTYHAKVQAPIANSGKLQVGQQVHLQLSVYPEREFGVLVGSLEQISLMANDDAMYLLEVTLPEKAVTSYGKTVALKPEMHGRAEVVTEDLSLMERLFYLFRGI